MLNATADIKFNSALDTRCTLHPCGCTRAEFLEVKMKRVWKDIRGYEGIYQVSEDGLVRSLYHNKFRILKMRNEHRYYQVCLSKYGNKKYPYVHCLVIEAFIGGGSGCESRPRRHRS